MEEGSIVKWLLAEGDAVTTDTLLFELETDKAIIDVPSPVNGVLLKISRAAGAVRVEEVVGWVGLPGEALEPEPRTEVPVEEMRNLAPRTASPTGRSSSPSTPAARRRATELRVDLATVTGSGPNGRITQEDVEQAARDIPAPAASRPGRGELARALAHAWRTVPHIHISRQLDADALAAVSARVRGNGISVTDLLLFALSRTLPSFPELTATWREERLEPAEDIHIAFAVDTGNALVAPVIRNVPSLEVAEISRRRRELTEVARSRQVTLADLTGGVFTLTNLGMQGADFFAPIVNWPETAILATGRMTQDAIVRDGAITIGWRMWANIALDHRATDGATGARFLAMFQRALDRMADEFQLN
jgi:pyruvate dehydrogenase E2 component (dihydrolipoamide acetyltransferase)